MSQHLRIAIVGGGIGGLTLANLLARQGLEATVYERDASLDARNQGYALGLTRDAGLQVLGQLGLAEAVEATGRRASDFAFLTPAGKRLMNLRARPGSPQDTVGIPRSALRALLLERLPPERVVWNARCTGLLQDGGAATLQFEDGREVVADLVVACDGSRSPLRKLLWGDSPNYLGLNSIGGVLPRARAHPLLAGGAFMTLGPGASFFAQTYGDQGETVWSWAGRAEERAFESFGPESLKGEALRRTEGWHAPIAELISSTADSDVITRAYSDRLPPAQLFKGAVVLLGDAAHGMSPFQGRGANTAMEDARDLAEVLPGAKATTLALRLGAFQRKALPRGMQMVNRSRFAARLMHVQGPIARFLRNGTMRMVGAGLDRSSPPALSAGTPAD